MMLSEEEKLPFTAHLEELRKRLIVSIVAIGVGFVLCYGFKEFLFQLLTEPLIRVMKPGEKLIFTGLAEAFFTYLKVSFLGGVVLASPVIIYQFWAFVAPGLYRHERKAMLPIIMLSVFFFLGGALFGYFVVFPLGFQFFISFNTEYIQAMPAMKEYLSFASMMLIAFGLVFEMPLVLIFMVRLGIVSIDFLKKNRKYAILMAFIIGAILTPPDVVTQTCMAIPMILLYEGSIWAARLFAPKKPVEEDAAAE